MSEREEFITGEPAGTPLFGGADIAQEWAIGFAIAVLVAGMASLLLARRLSRGGNAARFGLLVMSVFVFGYATCGSCIGSPMMAAVDGPDPIVSGLVLGSWMLNQAAAFAFSITLGVLLLMPSTQRFAQS